MLWWAGSVWRWRPCRSPHSACESASTLCSIPEVGPGRPCPLPPVHRCPTLLSPAITPYHIPYCWDNKPGCRYWSQAGSLGWIRQYIPPKWPVWSQRPGRRGYSSYRGIIPGVTASGVMLALCGDGPRHSWLIWWRTLASWPGSSNIFRIDLRKLYIQSGYIYFRSYPRNGQCQGTLKPDVSAVSGRWVRGSESLACTILWKNL